MAIPSGEPLDLAAELADMRARLDALSAGGTRDSEVLVADLESAYEELRVTDEEIRTQQDQLADLLHNREGERLLRDRLTALLPVPVLTTDARGLIASANPAAIAVLGVRTDRIVGKPLAVFVEADERSELRARLATAAAGGEELRMAVTLRPRHGAPHQVEMAAVMAREDRAADPLVSWLLLDAHHAVEQGIEARLARCLAEVTVHALDSTDTATTLSRIANTCQEAFASRAWISVTVGAPAEPDLVATDSKEAQCFDGAQMAAGEGPCQTAWDETATVVSPAVAEDPRWPRLAAALTGSPVAAVVAAPIRWGETSLGALNVYSDDAELVSPRQVQCAEILAVTVAAVLHEIDVKQQLEALTQNMRIALESRAPIEQAKGLLMAAHGCTADQAFAMLADASSRSNVKLREIAARMVAEAAEGRGPADPGGRPVSR